MANLAVSTDTWNEVCLFGLLSLYVIHSVKMSTNQMRQEYNC